MSRPRVLHLIHHLRIGGAERMLVELAPRLIERGYDAHVGCLDDRGALFEPLAASRVPAHFVGRRRGLDPVALWRLVRLLRGLRARILNTHSFSAGLWGRLAALPARTPRIVTTVHTVAGWSQPTKQRVGNSLLRPVTDRIVAVSDSVRRSLIAQGAPAGIVRVIHNGVRTDRFRPASDAAAERARLGLPADGYLIGLVARCSPEKGGDLWIRALRLLMAEDARTHGVLVGDGPALPAWRALAASLGIADRITFAGDRTDVAPWFSVLSMLVCPSIQESFGMSALEGQAAGVPVVATRVDGFLEVLNDPGDALLAAPGDPVSLFAAMRAVRRDPALAARLAAAGPRNAARFSVERMADAYAALYRELAPEAGPGATVRNAEGGGGTSSVTPL